MSQRLLWVITALFCSGTFALAQHPMMLPQPEHVQYGKTSVPIQGLTIRFGSRPASEDRFAADELARGLNQRTGVSIAVSDSAPGAERSITLTRTGAPDPL